MKVFIGFSHGWAPNIGFNNVLLDTNLLREKEQYNNLLSDGVECVECYIENITSYVNVAIISVNKLEAV